MNSIEKRAIEYFELSGVVSGVDSFIVQCERKITCLEEEIDLNELIDENEKEKAQNDLDRVRCSKGALLKIKDVLMNIDFD